MRLARRHAGALAAGVPALALAVALAVVLAGCGVPGPGSERVPSSEMPPVLLEPAPAGGPAGVGEPDRTAGDPSAPLAARAPSTYLVARDVLVAVPLEQQGAAAPDATPLDDDEATVLATRLVRRLNGSPTTEQRDRGLSSALSAGVPARLVEVVGGTASVELRQPERYPVADRLPLAIGQVVLTVTSVPGITRVELLRDRDPMPAVLPGGERADRPVSALDYADLLAAP